MKMFKSRSVIFQKKKLEPEARVLQILKELAVDVFLTWLSDDNSCLCST